ncbi:MAG TPA: GNAT family N-acetyltransferase [Kribbella sp.]|nr:GNAT family N-acetyltransferase [Kribbella sp.]
MELAARIASAQLHGLSRSRRQIVAGPLVGLLHDSEVWFLSTVVAATPGEPFEPDEVPWALDTIRKAFAAEGRWVSAELIEEANPGLADALAANGMTIVSRPPLLAVEPAGLKSPVWPEQVTVSLVSSVEEQLEVDAVAVAAYEADELATSFQPDAANGGCVLVRWDGTPVATAAWTAVADGVTEVAGVGTLHEYRRRGLGAIATAEAARAAFEHADASLAWLTPGDDGADRVYRSIGFAPSATAVHLGDPGGHLGRLL